MRIWLLAFVIGLTACSQFTPDLQNKSEDEKLADKVLKKVALQMMQEAHLRPCGTMGQMMNEIQRLGLSFNYYQPVDIAQGRKLLIQGVEAMLKEVNQEERIRPYLIRYPFLPRNVQIAIFLRNPDGTEVTPGSLKIIVADEGYLYYKIHRATGYGLICVYKETYDEALARLADPSLPLVAFEPDREMNVEELAKLRQGIRFLAEDGINYHLGENGSWVKD